MLYKLVVRGRDNLMYAMRLCARVPLPCLLNMAMHAYKNALRPGHLLRLTRGQDMHQLGPRAQAVLTGKRSAASVHTTFLGELFS